MWQKGGLESRTKFGYFTTLPDGRGLPLIVSERIPSAAKGPSNLLTTATPSEKSEMRTTRIKQKDCPPETAFTLIELLVVIAIISVLAGLFLPALGRAKHLGAEKSCASNLRQINLLLFMYSEDYGGRYPVELTEHNPHPNLLELLENYQSGATRSCYCPRAPFLEKFASDAENYIPQGAVDSVVDTTKNRALGNIGYVYWSFLANKYCPEAVGNENLKHWRNPKYFIPRKLTTTRVEWITEDQTTPEAPLATRWVMSDFFRRKAPFPHARRHARGLNVVFLGGHVDLMQGRPRDNFR